MITFKNQKASFDRNSGLNTTDVVVGATVISAITALIHFVFDLPGWLTLTIMLGLLAASVIALAVEDLREFPVKRHNSTDFPAGNTVSNENPVTNQFSSQNSSDFPVESPVEDNSVNEAVGAGKPDDTGNSTGPHIHVYSEIKE